MSSRGAALFSTLLAATASAVLAWKGWPASPDADTLNPDALRPPQLVSYPAQAIQQQVIGVFFAELERAVRAGDTMSLDALVPDSVIPATEKRAALLDGCTSFHAGVNRARGRGPQAGGLDAVQINQVEVSPAGQGDTVALGSARFLSGARTSSLSVALTRTGHARSMARVQGLLLGICLMGT